MDVNTYVSKVYIYSVLQGETEDPQLTMEQIQDQSLSVQNTESWKEQEQQQWRVSLQPGFTQQSNHCTVIY